MSDRANTKSANVTIGRPQWTGAGHLLGAGMVTPDSTHDNFSELGLSANPAAMGHGLKRAPATAAVVAPAGPYGAAEKQDTAHSRLRPEPGPAVQHAPPTPLQQHRPFQPQREQNMISTSSAFPSPGLMHDGKATGSRSNQSTSVAASTPGHMQLVVPPGEQKTWYGTGWARLKHAVLGSAAAPDLLELGPPWTKWPDYGRVNNINALVRALWPSLSNAIEQQLVLQLVPALLSDAAKAYGAGYVKGLELSQFSLGPVPPRLDGFKVYEESDDEQLMLEVAAAWGSLAKVTVTATLQLLGHTFQLPLTVQNVQFQALLRVTARPLLTFMPYVGSVGLSLLEPPHVDFELPIGVLGGLDLMALPLIRGVFRLGIRVAARQYTVYPKGIQLPLVEGGGVASVPCGVLELRLVKLKGLQSEDLLGHSDPYVKIRLREGRELRSKTINNNNEPVFDQTFSLVVDDPDKQVLQLVVYDEDLRGLKDKIIGVAVMPLKQSAALAMPKTRVAVSLEVQKIMAPSSGTSGMFELPVRVAGLPITAAATGGRWLYKNVEGALGRGGSAGGSSGAGDLYNRVLDETGWLGPGEEYLVERRAEQPSGAAAGAEAACTPSTAIGSGDNRLTTDSSSLGRATPPSLLGGSSTGHEVDQQVLQGGQSLDGVTQGSSRAFAVDSGTIRSAALRNWQQHEAGVAAAVGAGGGAPVDNGASRSAYDSGLRRLASHSAPLMGQYDDQDVNRARLFAGGSSNNNSSSGSSSSALESPRKSAIGTTPALREGGAGKAAQALTDEDLKEVQGEAEPRGTQQALKGDQLTRISRGIAFLELTYTPIRQPAGEASGAGGAPAPGVQAAVASGGVPVSPLDKGILAVTLVRAKGLTGWQGEADPYVTLTLLESGGGTAGNSSAVGSGSSSGVRQVHRSREPYRSNTIFNEDSPRWNENFDFVMVPANSVLLATVWDQTSLVEAATSLKISKERFKDQVLGRVKVPVMDVAAAGRLRSSWPLQGALMGELEMVLQWVPAHLMD